MKRRDYRIRSKIAKQFSEAKIFLVKASKSMERGQVLIETLLAVAVLSIVLVPFFQFFLALKSGSSLSRNLLQAALTLQSKVWELEETGGIAKEPIAAGKEGTIFSVSLVPANKSLGRLRKVMVQVQWKEPRGIETLSADAWVVEEK